jgi:predicted peptidase
MGELKVLNTGARVAQERWAARSQPFVILSTHRAPTATRRGISGMLAFAMASYDIDPKRVYITGLSCGAIGGWGYLGNHTNEVVAAAVLIAGDGNGAFAQAGCDLGVVPVWALHGDADGTVNVNGSINPIQNLNDCTDPAPVEAITLPGVGQLVDMTYDPEGPNDIYCGCSATSTVTGQAPPRGEAAQ